MKKHTLLFPVAIAFALFTSCSNESSSQFDGYAKAENGLFYKFYNKSEQGAKPQIGDFLMLKYEFKLQRNDSTLMDSKQASRDGSGYTEIGLQRSTFKGSLEDGILMMSKGDSASFIVPADSFFLRTMQMNELPKFINRGDYIKAIIKVGEIRSKQQVEEQQKKEMAEREQMMKEAEAKEIPLIEKYVADNKIKAKPTESGLYIVEIKKGSGANPKPGEMVEVNYVGRLLDGTVFDTSVESVAKESNTFNPQRPYQPIRFVLGQQQVIAGWDEGIAKLNKGAKAKFVIPSKLAYGPNPAGAIPAFSTLVFEVELISFGPADQPGQPQPGQAQQQGHEGHNHK